MARTCPNCNAKLKSWFIYCEKCGIKIIDDYEPEIQPEPIYEEIEESQYEEQIVEEPIPTDIQHFEKQPETVKTGNEFDSVLIAIEDKFDPRIVKNEEDFKNRLVQFLNTNFPNEVTGEGHTSVGGGVDIVIDGTYALKIKVLTSEGAMIFLVDMMMEYKHDFHDSAAILLDIGEITSNKIEEYIKEYDSLGIKTILKRAWFKDEKNELEQKIPWPSN